MGLLYLFACRFRLPMRGLYRLAHQREWRLQLSRVHFVQALLRRDHDRDQDVTQQRYHGLDLRERRSAPTAQIAITPLPKADRSLGPYVRLLK